MNYVIVDFEANDVEEIIEIGAIKMDKSLETISEFQSFVKPLSTKKLGSHIRKLTKISQEDIDNAENFISVFKDFTDWLDKDDVILTWGRSDKRFLSKDLIKNKLDTSILNRFINIQKNVSDILLKQEEVGLKRVLSYLNIEQIGASHRALNDAVNTSKIFIKLFSLFNNFEIRKNGQAVVNNKEIYVNIDEKRYLKHSKSLSISKLESKLEMLENTMQNELKKEKMSVYLYAVICKKISIVRNVLLNKQKKQILKSQGMSYENLYILLSSANKLEKMKDNLAFKIDKKDGEFMGFYRGLRKDIKKWKELSKKLIKPENLNIRRDVIFTTKTQMISTIKKALQMSYLNKAQQEDMNDVLVKLQNSVDSIKIDSIKKAN